MSWLIFLQGASTYAENVDSTMLFIVVISVILLLGITAAMIYFVIRYNKKRHPKAKQIHGNIWLEIFWIGVPTILVLFMFWYGFEGFYTLRTKAESSMTVDVTGAQWEWRFDYENGKKTDTLYIPVDKTTRLEMKSVDVNHSFYIPAFRLKEDVLPGRTTYMILEPRKTGAYDIACAEYCGVDHSFMYTNLVVLPQDDFNDWYGGKKGADKMAAAEKTPAELAGMDMSILKEKACMTCHSLDGSKMVGPSFKTLEKGEVTVLVDGEEKTIKIDEDYLRKSIKEPNAHIVKGFKKNTMPVPPKMTEEEFEKIVEILKAYIPKEDDKS